MWNIWGLSFAYLFNTKAVFSVLAYSSALSFIKRYRLFLILVAPFFYWFIATLHVTASFLSTNPHLRFHQVPLPPLSAAVAPVLSLHLIEPSFILRHSLLFLPLLSFDTTQSNSYLGRRRRCMCYTSISFATRPSLRYCWCPYCLDVEYSECLFPYFSFSFSSLFILNKDIRG